MCIVKTPKVDTSSTAANKDPTVIRNPFLDGVDPATKSLRMGRSALRIERAGVAGVQPPPVVAPVAPVAPEPAPGSAALANPFQALGGFGGGAGRIGRTNVQRF